MLRLLSPPLQVRRQLEYSIAEGKGVHLVKPPGTMEVVREIFKSKGVAGLYTGGRLHFGALTSYAICLWLFTGKLSVRDTSGTALYFFEYDAMRHLLNRKRNGEQGPLPAWLPIPVSLVPFICGSLAGVSSWALIYPLDV